VYLCNPIKLFQSQQTKSVAGRQAHILFKILLSRYIQGQYTFQWIKINIIIAMCSQWRDEGIVLEQLLDIVKQDYTIRIIIV